MPDVRNRLITSYNDVTDRLSQVGREHNRISRDLPDLREDVAEARERYLQTLLDVRDLVESIAKTVACKAAIKAGDRLTEEEMRALIDQLFATELPYSCPHGRPTFMRMTSEELDKRFGRT